jgi:uncharacterized membrane protein HdeD (DUF308 family)
MIVFALPDWRILALRGLAAIAFGALALGWPRLTLWALVILWGAFALADGILTLAAVATKAPATRARPWLFIAQGLLGIAAGIITFVWPGITALALLFVIAAWALLTGVMQIMAAVRLRRELEGEWLLGLNGALSVLFGVLLVITPGAGALVITWLIGWWAVVFGVLLLVLAWRVRKLTTSPRVQSARLREATA